MSGRSWSGDRVRSEPRIAWWSGPRSSCGSLTGRVSGRSGGACTWAGATSGNGPAALCASACSGSRMHLAAAGRRVFPPEVATHLVKLACELPDEQRRSLSLWTCAELARTLRDTKVVETILPQSVQRILAANRLKPWRVHHWLSPKTPRDEAFRGQVLEIMDLYLRVLEPHERVL